MKKAIGSGAGSVVLLTWAMAPPAMAACSDPTPATGATVTCSGAGLAPVAAQPGSSGVTVNLDASASAGFTRAVNPVGISVDTASTITNNGQLTLTGGGGSGGSRGAVLLGTGNGNTLINAAGASLTTTGAFNDGMAANGSGNTLTNNGTISTAGPNAYGISAAWGQTNLGQLDNTLINTGTVTTSGSNARAASILGGNGTIINSGTLSSTGNSGQTVYFQGNNGHLINTGTILASGAVGGVTPDAVVSNTVGSSFTALIENRAGGRIISQNGAGIRTLNGNTTIINAGLVESGVGTAIRMGNGNNTLILQTGSAINGSADGGAGSNTVTLQGSGTASNPFLNFQTLTMQGSAWTWNGSGSFTQARVRSGTLNVSGTLDAPTQVDAGTMLGGYGTINGAVTNNGTLAVANALPALAAGANGGFSINGALTNAGLVQVGGASVGNRLTVGSYVGQDGTLALNTYLAGDGAASDLLVINGGTASGSTQLRITNAGGPGAGTVANGIQVVQATNGATTNPGAFMLSGPVKAGAYQYYLAHGGVTPGTAESWYLRNSVPSEEGVTDPPDPAIGTPPLPEPPGPGEDPVVLYRPEVPVYAALPGVARQLGIQQLATFHERQGEQSRLTQNGALPAAWARAWGGHDTLSQRGDASPQFKGSVFGAQVGQDIYARASDSGHRDHFGLFAGFARAVGDVNGFALGHSGRDAGSLAVNAYSVGGYWTHIGPGGWYTDTVLMGSSLRAKPRSVDGLGGTIDGRALTASIEAGLPIPLGGNLELEPQAQLVWQRLSFDDLDDGISTVGFNRGNTFLGRAGVRLLGRFESSGASWQLYARLNLLRSFGNADRLTFGGDSVIGAGVGQTATKLDLGVTAQVGKATSLYASASGLANLGGARQRSVSGSVGVRWAW
ncbi:autotransporter outer membrane beta-barrel domain-containing protein [Achromobacter xylosoxidans]|uniref:autotransporter family protein n=2 Tax=Alcaligenes xylosoxydans xylosoxydans TaxID=85698 RepID=UPI001F137FB9|nr:autotransporter outer membrane beta-barrel domain-containing protein [Achromobacter xylosoxidans]